MKISYQIIDDSIPIVIVDNNDYRPEKNKNVILCFHGLTSDKTAFMKELKSLASINYIAVGIDAIGHGQRKYTKHDEIFSNDNPEFKNQLVDTIVNTSNEIPKIIDYLIAEYNINKVGVMGISMGGYIAYLAPLVDKRISVITPILASPKLQIDHQKSPHKYPEKFFPTAILAQNAKEDEVIDNKSAREFCEHLKPFYLKAKEKLSYIEYPNNSHFMQEKDWETLWNNVMNWFLRFC